MKLKVFPSIDEFEKELLVSLQYIKEVDSCSDFDHELGRWQEWIQSWPDQIFDENGGL